MVAAEFEIESVKLLDWQFGFFRLPRGILRRPRHCRSTAEAQHGMYELARLGMAGERHGMCELAFILPCLFVRHPSCSAVFVLVVTRLL